MGRSPDVMTFSGVMMSNAKVVMSGLIWIKSLRVRGPLDASQLLLIAPYS